MMCRVQDCGAEGLFHETEGYCPRCYGEIQSYDKDVMNQADPTGYYERPERKREKIVLCLIGLAVLSFLLFIGRALWLMIFE